MGSARSVPPWSRTRALELQNRRVARLYAPSMGVYQTLREFCPERAHCERLRTPARCAVSTIEHRTIRSPVNHSQDERRFAANGRRVKPLGQGGLRANHSRAHVERCSHSIRSQCSDGCWQFVLSDLQAECPGGGGHSILRAQESPCSSERVRSTLHRCRPRGSLKRRRRCRCIELLGEHPGGRRESISDHSLSP
jgi:hypothetical protein